MAKKAGFRIRILLGFLFLFAAVVIFLDQLSLTYFLDIGPFRTLLNYIIAVGSAVAGILLLFKKFFVEREAVRAINTRL